MARDGKPFINSEVKEIIRKSCVQQWLIAKEMGVHEGSLSRMLNKGQLTQKRKQDIIHAVERLTQQKWGVDDG